MEPDYKEMYLELFRAISSTQKALQLASEFLIEAQIKTEEMFISSEAHAKDDIEYWQ